MGYLTAALPVHEFLVLVCSSTERPLLVHESLFLVGSSTKTALLVHEACARGVCMRQRPDQGEGEMSGNKKPADNQRVPVVLGRIELPTHGFSVHCSTI